MALSRRAIETLTDLVEIKLSCLQVFDRDDAREQATLELCRRELAALGSSDAVVAMAETGRKRRSASTAPAASVAA